MRAKCAPSDLVQETALDAYRTFEQFHGEQLEELYGWLRRILLDNATSARRRYELTAKRELSRKSPWKQSRQSPTGYKTMHFRRVLSWAGSKDSSRSSAHWRACLPTSERRSCCAVAIIVRSPKSACTCSAPKAPPASCGFAESKASKKPS